MTSKAQQPRHGTRSTVAQINDNNEASVMVPSAVANSTAASTGQISSTDNQFSTPSPKNNSTQPVAHEDEQADSAAQTVQAPSTGASDGVGNDNNASTTSNTTRFDHDEGYYARSLGIIFPATQPRINNNPFTNQDESRFDEGYDSEGALPYDHDYQVDTEDEEEEEFDLSTGQPLIKPCRPTVTRKRKKNPHKKTSRNKKKKATKSDWMAELCEKEDVI